MSSEWWLLSQAQTSDCHFFPSHPPTWPDPSGKCWASRIWPGACGGPAAWMVSEINPQSGRCLMDRPLLSLCVTSFCDTSRVTSCVTSLCVTHPVVCKLLHNSSQYVHVPSLPRNPFWWNFTEVKKVCVYVCVSHSIMLDSLWLHGLQLTRLLCPWNTPGRNTGVGCHSLFQGIFPTQGSNLGFLHWGWILYHLSHQGSPMYRIYREKWTHRLCMHGSIYLPQMEQPKEQALRSRNRIHRASGRSSGPLPSLQCMNCFWSLSRTLGLLSFSQGNTSFPNKGKNQSFHPLEEMETALLCYGKIKKHPLDGKLLPPKNSKFVPSHPTMVSACLKACDPSLEVGYPSPHLARQQPLGWANSCPECTSGSEVKVAQSCPTLCDSKDWWNSPGNNTGVGSLSLLQGSPQPRSNAGSNPGLLHCG